VRANLVGTGFPDVFRQIRVRGGLSGFEIQMQITVSFQRIIILSNKIPGFFIVSCNGEFNNFDKLQKFLLPIIEPFFKPLCFLAFVLIFNVRIIMQHMF